MSSSFTEEFCYGSSLYFVVPVYHPLQLDLFIARIRFDVTIMIRTEIIKLRVVIADRVDQRSHRRRRRHRLV